MISATSCILSNSQSFHVYSGFLNFQISTNKLLMLLRCCTSLNRQISLCGSSRTGLATTFFTQLTQQSPQQGAALMTARVYPRVTLSLHWGVTLFISLIKCA